MMLQLRSPRSILVMLRGVPRILIPEERDDAAVILAEQPFQSDADYKALVAVAGGAVVSSMQARRFYRCRAAFLAWVEAA